MALTKETRDKLPASDFAVPGKRALPMHDADHVKMAWDMVDRTKGLTDEERASARRRILTRAKSLGVDTKGWKVAAMAFDISLQAMSLEVPDTPDHPNKAPFSGVLVRLDQASDEPPHGSFGMRTILTRAAAESALNSLLGMGVNYTANLKGHDPQAKIGIIDSATIEEDDSGPFVQIGGFLYASDFRDAVASIRSRKDDLGFSFEAERIYISNSEIAETLQIDKLTFTGAAILYKNSAAYQTTSIAAAAAKEKKVEEFEKIMAKLTEMSDRLGKVEAAQTQRVEAASVADKVQKHSDALKKVADGMEAAGLGNHPTRGHVHILRHMADDMMAEACKGVMASSYSPPNMYSSARVEAASVDEATKKEITDLKAGMADLKTMLTDLKAATTKNSGAPARKTVDGAIGRLLAKSGLTLPEGEGKLSIAAIDAALKPQNLDPTKRMEIKNALRNAGLIEAEAA